MRHLLRIHLILLSLCVFVGAGHASDLPIGSLSLSLGMEQAAVMKELHARFHVIPMEGDSNQFYLSESKPPDVQVLGGVAFKNGRLAWIQRNWGSFTGKVNSIEVSKALFSAIESAMATSGASATVRAKVQRIPGAEFKSVSFSFPGGKVISLTATEGDPKFGQFGQEVSIDESVSSKP